MSNKKYMKERKRKQALARKIEKEIIPKKCSYCGERINYNNNELCIFCSNDLKKQYLDELKKYEKILGTEFNWYLYWDLFYSIEWRYDK